MHAAAALGGTGGLGKEGKRERRSRGTFICARIKEIKPQTRGIESGRTRTRFLEIKTNELDSGSKTPRFALILGGKGREDRGEQNPSIKLKRSDRIWPETAAQNRLGFGAGAAVVGG